MEKPIDSRKYNPDQPGWEPANFDAIEIHGVSVTSGLSTGQLHCEMNDADPMYFSVYLHKKAGGVDSVGDFQRLPNAILYAQELHFKFGWPLHNFVPIKRPDLVTLTIEEIRGLARFAGLKVEGEVTEDDRETEITIEEGPERGVQDDDGSVLHYKHIAFYTEYPEEGVGGLGKPVSDVAKPTPTTVPEKSPSHKPDAITHGPAFDEHNQNEPWRNVVAAQLNQIVGRMEFVAGDPCITEIDQSFCAAALAIVKRVQEFEEIKTVEELQTSPQS